MAECINLLLWPLKYACLLKAQGIKVKGWFVVGHVTMNTKLSLCLVGWVCDW